MNYNISEESEHKDLIKFLERICNTIGETITEYHWREAIALIDQYKDGTLDKEE